VQLADAFRPQLSDVDARALTGELAAFLLGSLTAGLAPGVDGWVDDDYALLAPWGFDVEAIGVPVLVWQGEQDRLVPAAHARWLRGHVAGAESPVLPEEGHLTLFANRVDDVHEWLRNRLS
jgi:pimeloyl-ACP methyl ester carboxylesterase